MICYIKKNPENYLIDFYLFKTCFWIRPRIFFQITAAAIFHSTFLLDLFYLYFSKFYFIFSCEHEFRKTKLLNLAELYPMYQL